MTNQRKTWDRILFHSMMSIVFIILFFIESNQTIDPVEIPRTLLLSVSITVILLVILIFFRDNLQEFAQLISHPILLCYYGFILVNIFSITHSTNNVESIYEIVKLFNSFNLLIVLIYYFKNNPLEKIKIVSIYVSIFVLIATLTGFYQILELSQREYSPDLIVGKFANPNLFSSIILFSLPFAGIKILLSRKADKIPYMVILLLALGLIYTLQSNAVWLALLICIVLIIRFLMNKNFKRLALPKYIANTTLLVFYASLLCVCFYYVYKHQNYLLNILAIENASLQGYDSFAERVLLWKKTAAMIQDHFWTGVGAGNWKIEIPNYQLYGGILDAGEIHFRTPHNDFLWTWAETGVLGIGFYIAIMLISIWVLERNLKSRSTEKRIILICIELGIIAYVIVSLFSYPKERVAHQVIWMTFMAIIISLDRKSYTQINPRLISFLWIGLIFISTWTVWHTYQRIYYDRLTKKIILAKEDKNWARIIRLSQRINPNYYNLDGYVTPVYLNSGIAYFQLNQRHKALLEFQKAYHIHPNHIFVLSNLATCYQLEGDAQKAISFYRKALAINPNFQNAIINLAIVFYQQEKFNDSYELLQRVKTQNLLPLTLQEFIKTRTQP